MGSYPGPNDFPDHSQLDNLATSPEDMIVIDSLIRETMLGTIASGGVIIPNWILHRPDECYIHQYVVPDYLAGDPDRISEILYNTVCLSWVLYRFNEPQSSRIGWPVAGSIISWIDKDIINIGSQVNSDDI